MSNSYYNSTFTAAIGTLARSSTLRSQFSLVETGITAMEAALATKASPTFTGTTTLAAVSYTGALTGGTGVINIGSSQIYKDTSGNVGLGIAPSQRLTVYTAGVTTSVAQFVNGTTGPGALTGTLMGIDSAGSGYIMVQQAFPMIFGTSQTERMRIDATGNVGIGATANASALLDVQSTTKGLRLPNMTTEQKNAISNPAAGLLVFDTTLSKACLYTGAAWQTITSA